MAEPRLRPFPGDGRQKCALKQKPSAPPRDGTDGRQIVKHRCRSYDTHVSDRPIGFWIPTPKGLFKFAARFYPSWLASGFANVISDTEAPVGSINVQKRPIVGIFRFYTAVTLLKKRSEPLPVAFELQSVQTIPQQSTRSI